MAKKKYQLVAGVHYPYPGSAPIKAPAVVESEHDLSKKFRGKFLPHNPQASGPVVNGDQRPGDAPAKEMEMDPEDVQDANQGNKTAEDDDPGAGSQEGDPGAGGQESGDGDLGENKTESFGKLAEDNGLVMYKKDRVYSVYDATDLTKPLNEEELTSIPKVEAWLETFLED